MGIRPFVAIRQDLSASAPNILESDLKGILVGPCVQAEDIFSETLNVSASYGTISAILADAAIGDKIINTPGLIDGATLDFDTISFGGKDIKAKIELSATEIYAGSVKSSTEKHIIKVDITTADHATIAVLLAKGASVGDTIDVTVDNLGTPETETLKVRSMEVVDNAGTDELYIYLWTELSNVLIVDETVALELVQYKNISEASLGLLSPIDISAYGTSTSTYTINNSTNSVDGGFSVKIYVYEPIGDPDGVTFDNRQILTDDLTTLSNYTKTENIYKVMDGSLYNFFEANRADLSNNIFEVTTENYVSQLGTANSKNKLSYAMKLISSEVPGASMKVYVTEDDTSDSYTAALATLATASEVYSITVLTDNDSVINSTIGMVNTAAEEATAKWKMAVNCPRVPHMSKKIESSDYTISQIASTDSYYIDSVNGGFLSVGTAVGDYIFGNVDLDDAGETYYDQYGESYSAAAIAKVDSVITDNKLQVTVITPSFDLSVGLSGQNAVVAILDTHANLITTIKNKTESIDNHGVVSIFPDKYEVMMSDESVIIPGFYAAAITNAVMAHLPPQQGLSNLSYNSISRVIGSSFTFTDGELDEIASSGVFVLLQQNYSTRPYVLRQLTTDVSSLETMEINKVRCLDFATLAFSDVLQDFVGKRNVNDENIQDIERLLESVGKTLVETTYHQYLGSVITTYEIVSVFVPDGEKDAISCVIDVETPTSLNKIRLFVSSGTN